ncbi:hypothetical protein M8494_27110 [Serratia ureilytica]
MLGVMPPSPYRITWLALDTPGGHAAQNPPPQPPDSERCSGHRGSPPSSAPGERGAKSQVLSTVHNQTGCCCSQLIAWRPR